MIEQPRSKDDALAEHEADAREEGRAVIISIVLMGILIVALGWHVHERSACRPGQGGVYIAGVFKVSGC